ncbi:hypothetical protein Verru16b_02238 [Lacunisphaera limnophila]|uniref:Uncharacterized protein n=1 Tax=Lacunisphaera limnophila TaxID=1838286 RepID=A0A1D8AW88_9BACT|nr:hypothetical protein [Lacunisphaera limnophila]AOS45162.1 hypothetical protein Verru16b_02238 [Lacunisphaera limnophila]
MADKKIEKALYGPSTTEVALGAVLGLGAGLLAACVFLVFKPVAQVREVPKEPVRGTVYYVPGGDSNAKSRQWTAKQKQFLAGQTVEVVEDELNAWAVGAFAAAALEPGKPGAAPAADGGIFQPGKPNFKIADGKIRIGFPCFINWYGLGREVFVITTGSITRTGDRFGYVPETIYLGSCPMHLLPAVTGPLVSHLLGKQKLPDELKSAWAKVDDVTIEGNKLKLVIQ